MAKYRTRRSRPDTKSASIESKLFIQLLLCAAIVCGFMIFKDAPLPNGKTTAQYVTHFLNTTVKIDEIAEFLKGANSIPASGNVITTPTASPDSTPSQTPEITPEATPNVTPAG